MLKALELSGFKSFADRTRFEFPRGISRRRRAERIRQIQHRRCREMGARLAKRQVAARQGNDRRHLQRLRIARRRSARPKSRSRSTTQTAGWPIDAKEVHVTRRVYRSGEGEYLINRQPCRLRDIRDLLAGTGITTEAYCIIEQGKVDALLQSSPRDRRVIFEEAAGISQFKAKKATATRRLERVEQNLLAAFGHRRRSGKPAAERPVAGRQGTPISRDAPSGCNSCAPKSGSSIGLR